MTGILIIQFAWGLREMLAGYVLLSAVIGTIFVGAIIALNVPVWIALVAYPAICSLTMLLCAAAWNIRTSTTATENRMSRRYSPS